MDDLPADRTQLAPPPMHLVSRELLERVRRDLLARVLEPYRLWLEAKRIKLDALRDSPQDDHALVHPLHDLLNGGDPLLPPALTAALPALDAVATEWGHEQLRRLDAKKVLPQERLGNETLAAVAYLDHPELFAQVKVGAKPARVTGYTEYTPRALKPLPRDPARFAALGRALGAAFAQRGRPKYCEPLVTHFARESIIDFVFARLPSTTEQLTESLSKADDVDEGDHAAGARVLPPRDRAARGAGPGVRAGDDPAARGGARDGRPRATSPRRASTYSTRSRWTSTARSARRGCRGWCRSSCGRSGCGAPTGR